MSFKRFVPFLAAAVFAGAWELMLWLAVPDIYWGDNPELTETALELGVAHSPGYPLMAQVGHLFGSLPLTSHPFRLNAAAAWLTALAFAGLYLGASRMLASPWIALLAPSALASSAASLRPGLLWDVYALHYMILGFVVWGAAAVSARPDFRRMGALFLVLAFGCFHHILMQLVFFAWLAFWAARAGKEKWRLAAVMAVCAAAASAVFLYVPLAAARGPYMNWWNADTFENFRSLILMHGYQSTWPKGFWMIALRLNLPGVTKEMNVGLLALAGVGVVFGLRPMRPAKAFLVLTGAITFLGTVLIAQHDKPEVLRVQLYIVLALLSAGGLAALYRLVADRGEAYRPAAFFIAFITAAFTIYWNFQDLLPTCFRHNKDAVAYAELVKRPLPPGSVLLMGGDYSQSVLPYMEAMSRLAPDAYGHEDIMLVPASFLSFDWKIQQLRRRYPDLYLPNAYREDPSAPNFFSMSSPDATHAIEDVIRVNMKNGKKIYTTFPLNEGYGLISVPQQFVYQVGDLKWLFDADRTSKNPMIAMIQQDSTPSVTTWSLCDPLSIENAASVYNERGRVYAALDEPALALSQYERCLDMKPDYAEALSNKGAVLQRIPNQWQNGHDNIKRALEIEPYNTVILYNYANSLYRGTQHLGSEKEVYEKLQEAEDALRKAEKYGMQTAQLYNLRGSISYNMKDVRGAAESFMLAVQADPNYFRPYCNMANILMERRDCAGALQNYQICTNLAPWHISSRRDYIYALGFCSDSDDDKRAEIEFGKLYRDYPDHPEVKKMIREMKEWEDEDKSEM